MKILFGILFFFGAMSLNQPIECDPLFGCPIDPIQCIKHPSSCGL